MSWKFVGPVLLVPTAGPSNIKTMIFFQARADLPQPRQKPLVEHSLSRDKANTHEIPHRKLIRQ